MIHFSNNFSVLQQAIKNKEWTWNNLASCYLSGVKVGRAMSNFSPKVGILKWVATAADTYKLYNQALALGFFEKYPRLLKPIQFAAVAVTVLNFGAVASKYSAKASSKNAKDFWKTKNPIWNYSPLVLAMGTNITTGCEFKNKPVEAMTFFATYMITGISNHYSYPAKGTSISTLSKIASWSARGNQFWNGDWQVRCVFGVKAAYKIFTNKH